MRVMGLKEKVSKAVVVVMASALVISSLFTEMGVSTEAGSAGNAAFLGDYAKYGIIANELNQTSHMQTNFLVGIYTNNDQYTGADLSHAPDGELCAGEIHIGEAYSFGSSSMSAQDVQRRLNDGAKDTIVVVDAGVKAEVASALTAVSNYANSVVSVSSGDHTNVIDTSVMQIDMNNTVIDASQVDASTVYVQADSIIDAIQNKQLQAGGLHISMKQGQTVVMNITRGEVTIPRYNVNIVDGNITNSVAENVIWNMPNASSVSLESDNMMATVIAPRASVYLAVTSKGWLVCNKLTGNSGEWHFISERVPRVVPPEPIPDPTPEPSATPNPTPEPSVTPDPTPEPSTTPDPTPEPSVTPDPTPEPSATPTPTPGPEATPTPTPGPEATPTPTPGPEATPTPTPGPEATPTPTPGPEATPTPTPGPEATPTPTPGPNATPTPEPGTTPEPTPGPEATPTPTPEPNTTPEPTPPPTVTQPPAETQPPQVTDPPQNEDTPQTDNPPQEVTNEEDPPVDPPAVLGRRRTRTVRIDDDKTPLSDAMVLGSRRRPQTSDESDAWMMMFLASLSALLAWILKGVKK